MGLCASCPPLSQNPAMKSRVTRKSELQLREFKHSSAYRERVEGRAAQCEQRRLSQTPTELIPIN